MILVDTSIWADHVGRGDQVLRELLSGEQVLMHPFVIGELALGNLRDWHRTVAMLGRLPRPTTASQEELLAFISVAALPGSGIGFVDAHLLAACRLTPETQLWTRDKRLATAAEALGLAWLPD